MTGNTWPPERSRRASIVAQFGQSRAELVEWALNTGDPLADAVVEEIHAGGRPVRQALAAGIKNGLGSLDDPPPAVAALLAQTERRPDYVDDALLDSGCRPYFSAHPAAHAISLSAGALIRVYYSPAIAGVLTATGRLVDAAERRLRETGMWVNSAMLPGGMRPGAHGYVATLQVRMLHAHMRRFTRGRGYAEAAFGVPINQVDLARTWMDFTITSYYAEEVLGFGRTSSELAEVYRYWWNVAHVLGIDARLVEGISAHDQAARVDAMLQAVTGPPGPDSAELAEATLKAIGGVLNEIISVPRGAAMQALYALTRRFHGHDLGDELRLPRGAAADALLGPGIAAIRLRRSNLRADPVGWEHEHEKGIAAARELIAGTGEHTAYEHQAETNEMPG